MQDKVLTFLGMAQKAGKMVSGEFSVESAIKKGKAYLVIIADDASDNTKKKFKNSCEFYEVPLVIYSDKENLGHAIGKELRSSAAVVDEGFANGVIKKLEQMK